MPCGRPAWPASRPLWLKPALREDHYTVANKKGKTPDSLPLPQRRPPAAHPPPRTAACSTRCVRVCMYGPAARRVVRHCALVVVRDNPVVVVVVAAHQTHDDANNLPVIFIYLFYLLIYLLLACLFVDAGRRYRAAAQARAPQRDCAAGPAHALGRPRRRFMGQRDGAGDGGRPQARALPGGRGRPAAAPPPAGRPGGRRRQRVHGG